MSATAVAGFAALALAGCAAPGAAPSRSVCTLPAERAATEWIYFGTATPNGEVSAAEWSDFLGREVTPRFPAGLTVWSASGQWRGDDGQLTREASYVLNLLHSGSADEEARVRELVAGYKQRFRQEAVLRVSGVACRTF